MTSQADKSVDAIILAGSRPEADALATRYAVTVKALVPVAGKAMLARVAQALGSHRAISKIRILAQDFKPFRRHPDTAPLAEDDTIEFVESAATIALSIDRVLQNEATTYPMLITTADNVLLDASMISDFVEAARGTDIAIAVVEKSVLLRRYPESKRTWLKLRGGHFSGANLFCFGSVRARELLGYWAEVEQDRKKGWKLLTIFGPMLLFLAITRILTVDQLATRIGKKLGLTIRVVRMTQAEACIDVDKEDDLGLAEKILRERSAQAGT
ncbi:NTP transferase domain-containing protein [Parasphingorhabdus sp.]|uniref:NTP transferase domain-containing protein n=1 Tax=Parasphingorhabdus sp. TaxID=2709688 RepID=UPI003265E5BB